MPCHLVHRAAITYILYPLLGNGNSTIVRQSSQLKKRMWILVGNVLISASKSTISQMTGLGSDNPQSRNEWGRKEGGTPSGTLFKED